MMQALGITLLTVARLPALLVQRWRIRRALRRGALMIAASLAES